MKTLGYYRLMPQPVCRLIQDRRLLPAHHRGVMMTICYHQQSNHRHQNRPLRLLPHPSKPFLFQHTNLLQPPTLFLLPRCISLKPLAILTAMIPANASCIGYPKVCVTVNTRSTPPKPFCIPRRKAYYWLAHGHLSCSPRITGIACRNASPN